MIESEDEREVKTHATALAQIIKAEIGSAEVIQ